MILAISILGVYPKEIKSGSWRDICTSKFTSALFTIAKGNKRPSVNEWIKKILGMCMYMCLYALPYFTQYKSSNMKRDDRGWDGWVAPPTQWTWVWVDFGSWWWTGRPGMLWFMGSQRVGHDWATELNWLWKNIQLHSYKLVISLFALNAHLIWIFYSMTIMTIIKLTIIKSTQQFWLYLLDSNLQLSLFF